MLQVLLALIPGTLLMIYFFGWGILFNVLLSIFFAVSLEAVALFMRKRPVLVFLGDLSAVVTGWLFALTLPPLLPWWILLLLPSNYTVAWAITPLILPWSALPC